MFAYIMLIGLVTANALVPRWISKSSNPFEKVGHRRSRLSPLTMSYERRGNSINFGARMDVDERLRDIDPAALAVFLQDPTQIMAASWPRDRIRKLKAPGDFRLIQEPLDFAGLIQIDFFVDVHVDISPEGRVSLESYGIETTATVNGQRKVVPVELKLRGGLDPVVGPSLRTPTNEGARLKGYVAYDSGGALLGPLIFCPDVVLRGATSAINRTILLFARRDFVNGIARNFNTWFTPKQKAEIEASQRANKKQEQTPLV
mmetsp:Transcript_29541/g.59324  ORF Transcript_29541/g.59324 Transcript_29541/m.59324 type:complete len:260 (-) Transcript_29541:170-949(-)